MIDLFSIFPKAITNMGPSSQSSASNITNDLSLFYVLSLFYGPFGYIRARMAMSLRNAELTKKQKVTLAGIFLKQLESGLIYREFREYCRLFKIIGVEPYRQEIEKHKKSRKQYIRHAASRLLA